jgi:hypothetical protein
VNITCPCRRDKPNHPTGVYGNCEVVSRIAKKFTRDARHERVVEDVGSNGFQKSFLGAREDFDIHLVLSRGPAARALRAPRCTAVDHINIVSVLA